MKLTTIKTRKGTKVFQEDKHVKTIPGRYAELLKPKHIINPKRKRLTMEERFMLEVALFEHVLKTEMPLFYNLVKKSIPEATQKVTDRDGISRYELHYKNGTKLRCPPHLYRLCPNRKTPKFCNY